MPGKWIHSSVSVLKLQAALCSDWSKVDSPALLFQYLSMRLDTGDMDLLHGWKVCQKLLDMGDFLYQ